MHGEKWNSFSPTTQDDPSDFDEFWGRTLSETAAISLDLSVTHHPTLLQMIDTYDVTYRGFGGTPIRAWLRLPSGTSGELPGIVQFCGYGHGRGHALRDLRWAAAGYAHLIVDARDQGHGDTSDDFPDGNPSAGSFLTRGILSPETYYYRRIFTDAVRAVEALRSLEVVDANRVGAVGMSQGGGIAIVIAGLVPDLSMVVSQAPFMCELDRAASLSTEEPYSFLRQYFADRRLDMNTAQETLRYFDVVNHAKRAKAPALLSTGLLDGIAPPETVLPAFSAYGGEKEIRVWPYNGHEAGSELDEENALTFAACHLRNGQESTETQNQAQFALRNKEEK